jgi:hypothetical protein
MHDLAVSLVVRSFDSSTPKITIGLRPEEDPGNHSAEQTVNGELTKRIKGAQDHVEGDPGKREPAGPVMALQQKYSAEKRKKLGEFDEEIAIVKGMSRQDVAEMENKTNETDQYINAGEDRYGETTLVRIHDGNSARGSTESVDYPDTMATYITSDLPPGCSSISRVAASIQAEIRWLP